MSESLIQDVSDTAFWIASHRARETGRPDALFRDPLAGLLAGERGAKIAREMPRAKMTAWMAVIRTVIIDAYLRDAIAGGVGTVVNLGAGLDTRPYRLELPPTLRWIEADFAPMIEFKNEKLRSEKPRCRLERVAVDLSDDATRRRFLAGLGAGPKIFLTEGVVPYLTNEQAAALAADLRSVEGVRGWIVDYFAPQVHKYREPMQRKMANAPFRFRPDDWFAFFGERGWEVEAIRYLGEEAERVRRPAPLPLLARVMIRLLSPLAPPERRAQFKRFAGYALLKPASAK